MKKYYGVSQSCHGHEYRYIFDKDVLSENIYDGGAVPDEDVVDCYFPIGGSNSSATFITYLPDDDSIKAFLLSVFDDDNSCTDMFVQKFKLSYEELEQYDDLYGHKKHVEDMFKLLQTYGYDGLDYSDPFYGENRNMSFNELCELYDAITKRKENGNDTL